MAAVATGRVGGCDGRLTDRGIVFDRDLRVIALEAGGEVVGVEPSLKCTAGTFSIPLPRPTPLPEHGRLLERHRHLGPGELEALGLPQETAPGFRAIVNPTFEPSSLKSPRGLASRCLASS